MEGNTVPTDKSNFIAKNRCEILNKPWERTMIDH